VEPLADYYWKLGETRAPGERGGVPLTVTVQNVSCLKSETEAPLKGTEMLYSHNAKLATLKCT
jgi:hypothetical protein